MVIIAMLLDWTAPIPSLSESERGGEGERAVLAAHWLSLVISGWAAGRYDLPLPSEQASQWVEKDWCVVQVWLWPLLLVRAPLVLKCG